MTCSMTPPHTHHTRTTHTGAHNSSNYNTFSVHSSAQCAPQCIGTLFVSDTLRQRARPRPAGTLIMAWDGCRTRAWDGLPLPVGHTLPVVAAQENYKIIMCTIVRGLNYTYILFDQILMNESCNSMFRLNNSFNGPTTRTNAFRHMADTCARCIFV